jgi:hypothetical protein
MEFSETLLAMISYSWRLSVAKKEGLNYQLKEKYRVIKLTHYSRHVIPTCMCCTHTEHEGESSYPKQQTDLCSNRTDKWIPRYSRLVFFSRSTAYEWTHFRTIAKCVILQANRDASQFISLKRPCRFSWSRRSHTKTETRQSDSFLYDYLTTRKWMPTQIFEPDPTLQWR